MPWYVRQGVSWPKLRYQTCSKSSYQRSLVLAQKVVMRLSLSSTSLAERARSLAVEEWESGLCTQIYQYLNLILILSQIV